MSDQHMPQSGRVAIVEIAATKYTAAVILVEVCLNGETLTISDQDFNITEPVRQMAQQLIHEVRNEHGKRT